MRITRDRRALGGGGGGARIPSRRRRGITVVYSIISMAAIFALCSLGADYGRVQLAKYELQRAVDAASRAAALSLRQGNSSSQAQSDAIAVAGQNTVDGNALTLTTSHVLVGNWNSTTRVFTSGGTPANAVKISVTLGAATGNGIPLIFARVVGMSQCNISATSTALATLSAGGAAFIGLDSFTVGKSGDFNSYDSAAGTPSGGNRSNSGTIGSNGNIQLGKNSTLRGDAVLGPVGTLSYSSNFYTTGTTQELASSVTAPATESPTVTSIGNLNLSNSQTYTFAAGTYCVGSITAGNNVTIQTTGAVTLYVTGNISAGNSFDIKAYQDRPSNFNIRLYGTGKSFNVVDNFTMTAAVYGPGYSFISDDSADLRGTAVFKSIYADKNADFHYDTGLSYPIGGATGGGGSSGAVTTVK